MNSGSTDGGNYTCNVTNVAGTDSTTAKLYVQLNITSQPMDVIASVGEFANFTCVADGFPKPIFSWKKEESGNFIEVVNATGPNLNLNSSNYGRYQCIATVYFPMGPINVISVVSSPATLTRTYVIVLG